MTDGEDIRTYEIITSNGVIRTQIPASYKVTFGPVTPGGKGGGLSTGNVLRVYEAENKQRALFAHVASFRDLSIPIQKEAYRKRGTTQWYDPSDKFGPRSTWRPEDIEWGWAPEEDIISSGRTDDGDGVAGVVDPADGWVPLPAATGTTMTARRRR